MSNNTESDRTQLAAIDKAISQVHPGIFAPIPAEIAEAIRGLICDAIAAGARQPTGSIMSAGAGVNWWLMQVVEAIEANRC